MKMLNYQDQIRFLDNYRIICEKRILDLAPSHSLPILPSHIGTTNPSDDEFTLGADSPVNNDISKEFKQQDIWSKCEIQNLENTIADLQKDKDLLLDTLRNETMQNEE